MRTAEIVILCEDRQHLNFARRYLQRVGFDIGRISPHPLPDGRRSGEQHVREAYAEEVRVYRRGAARRKGVLLVVLDADARTVAERVRQLEEGLRSAGEVARMDTESIVHFIPKRNIETWILHLQGEAVTEEDIDTKARAIRLQLESASAAASFYVLTRPSAVVPPACLPSLIAAIPEARRLG